MEEKYKEILKYFQTYTYYDDIIHTNSYVSIDNIHQAIIDIGVNLHEFTGFYILHAKQLSINEYKTKNRRTKILMENVERFLVETFQPDFLKEYDFTDIEKLLIDEIMQGIKQYQSSISRRQYKKTLENIKKKLMPES